MVLSGMQLLRTNYPKASRSFAALLFRSVRYQSQATPTAAILHQEKVQWGDVDAFQHINNCVYLRYFENARIVYLEKLHEQAKELDFFSPGNVGPIMADAYVRYQAPLYYPDTIDVSIFAQQLRETDVRLHFEVHSQDQQLVVARGYGRMVCYDYNAGQKIAFPTAIVEAMQQLQPDLVMEHSHADK
eukprot:m.133769 g.133769  ORF g.133769 m.133769 type:complete len:187 (-) comp15955_c0_seq1:13-573(-)